MGCPATVLSRLWRITMRKTLAIVLMGLVTLSLPALAVTQTDDSDNTPAGEGVTVRVDCPGGVAWDTGMFDEFTPPAGCSSAASAGCFVNAINDGAFPADGRRVADDWVAFTTDPITGIKIWARYSAPGYGYHLENNGLHGYCVKFYGFTGECPDGSVPGEDAIGPILFSQYTTDFVEEEIFTGLIRNFNSCMILCPPFEPEIDQVYWVSVAADFDFTTWPQDPSAPTQWFWRQYVGLGISFCESAWWDTWNVPNTNWNNISVAINLPCWAGWDSAFVLYNDDPCAQEAACCVDGICRMTTEADCAAAGGTYYPGENCDTFECPPVATETTSWGNIKANYR
jgi:hypothetical protein